MVVRAVRIALVFGAILAAINHGDRLLLGDIDINAMLKILLTFCVPYSVSTYSSVLAIRENSITQKLE
ncbi:nitrate/nitrite transporter NrtS [Pseudosulfitobacter pseudonitzschiae]|uniref:nitrate/nitrite transporter NrtS n=1 Tax=Pseudosulfitobacter pseudonitzschiae TaxID=1402135 RepID=UPI003B78D7F5